MRLAPVLQPFPRLSFPRINAQLVLLALLCLAAIVAGATGHDATHLVLLGAVVAPTISDADTSNLNTVAANYVEYMDQEATYDLIWDEAPTLTIISKNADVVGAYVDQNVKFAGSQGIVLSGNYANALGNQSPEQTATFHVPMTPLFVIGSLDNQAIEQSRNRKGAFVPLVESALKSGLKDAANELSRALLGSGTASIGQIASISINPPGNYPVGSALVTLTSPFAYRFFEFNATLDVTQADGSAPLGAPDTVKVVGIDATAHRLVLSPPINSLTGAPSGSWGSGSWLVGNWFIRDGNYNANQFSSAISTQTGINGFQPLPFAGMGAWTPSWEFRQAGGLEAGTFMNVPRNLDGTRLAGVAVDGSNKSIIDAMIEAAVNIATYNKKGPKFASLGPASYMALLQALQSQKLYLGESTDVEVSASIAYKNVRTMMAGNGPISLIMEPNMPPKRAYMWSPDDFELSSVGGCPKQMMDINGNVFTAYQNQNGGQFKTGGYSNIVCKKPRGTANISLQQ